MVYYISNREYGSIAQLGEHLPYKQGVIGSSPIVPTKLLLLKLNPREWLSGRALPCQGKCREFESRFPLHFFITGFFVRNRRHSQEVRHGSAKPLSPVRIWVAPPKKRRSGEIGRRKGLKIPRWKHRTGSSPVSGTSVIVNRQVFPDDFFDIFYKPKIGAKFRGLKCGA